MTGQVKHVSLFSGITPDWRLVKLLASLKEKNTAALIGGIQKALREEGIELVDSTRSKTVTRARGRPHPPQTQQRRRSRYPLRPPPCLHPGHRRYWPKRGDQRKSVCGRGSDGRHRRDAAPRRHLTNGKSLCLVKASRGRAHLLFDVPVAGLTTIDTMIETRTTAMAVDAGRTLLLDKEEMCAGPTTRKSVSSAILLGRPLRMKISEWRSSAQAHSAAIMCAC